ncbi:MAG TPA: GNAT family N-acetyltransferase [Terrimicrobiaceae bacterium]
MIIRRAVFSDAFAICRLLGQLGYVVSSEVVERQLGLLLRDEAEDFIVGEAEDKKVVGFLSLHYIPQIAMEGEFARISYFCVDEEARSRGIGRALEEEAERLASQRGCDRIELHCHSHRAKAHDFYAHRGYEECPKYFLKMVHRPA